MVSKGVRRDCKVLRGLFEVLYKVYIRLDKVFCDFTRLRQGFDRIWPRVKITGQNPVPPVNIPIPTKIGSKMGGAPIPKWDTIGVDPRPFQV